MSNITLSNGLQLIDLLSNYPNGCPLSQISKISGINKSTVHRLLQTLQDSGYVKVANASGSYRLTTKCLTIGQKTLHSMNILSVVSPILERLNLDTGETVNFSILDKFNATMIYKLEPTAGMFQTRSYIGQRLSLYCSAMGKIFLAHQSQNFVKEYWNEKQKEIVSLTKNTITNLDAMLVEINNIKQRGFAIDNEENELGVTCFAFPIFDINNHVKYALSIALSSVRLKSLDKQFLLEQLKNTAKHISMELGNHSYID